jgi:F-type H+-transporting ATPase subunit b
MNIIDEVFISISEGGFGINTDILDTNVINIIILVAGLFVLIKNNLGESLSVRQQKIIGSIQEAEDRLDQAKTRLSEAQKQLSTISATTDTISADAQNTANQLKSAIINQGKEEIQRLTDNATVTMAIAEAQVKQQLLQQIATLTIKRVSIQLREVLNPEIQSQIIDKGIADI